MEIVSQESGEVVASVMPGTYVDEEATVEITECLVQECYIFRLLDQVGMKLTPDFFWGVFQRAIIKPRTTRAWCCLR